MQTTVFQGNFRLDFYFLSSNSNRRKSNYTSWGFGVYAAISYAELRTNIIPAKIKRRRITKLSIKEIMKVLKAVKLDYLTHESAAIKYSITTKTVGKIVHNFKYK